MIAAAMGTFEHDTTVTAHGDNTLGATIDETWWVGNGPNGGYVAAIAVRALETRIDTTDRPLRSFTVHYLRAPRPGPIEIEVVPEREGGSVTFARVELAQEGRAFAVALAVLARSHEAPFTLDAAPAPEAARPEEIEPGRIPASAPPMAHHFDARPALWSTGEEAMSGGRLRLHDEPRELDAALVVAMCDSWLPPIFTKVRPAPAVPTLDLTVHLRGPLPRPGDWVLGRFTTRLVSDGLLEEDAELFATDGRLLAQSRQLALVR